MHIQHHLTRASEKDLTIYHISGTDPGGGGGVVRGFQTPLPLELQILKFSVSDLMAIKFF